ncbi:hypothetical protein jhhlp_000371 [Lomentospora prolificans]|uniref:Nucleotidyl transferase domain-containing protein n=1 Tax=Lomentospora prolificans TaxID=41688 RepID=A0A2N3NKS2_9PEZI|nr:hypothetical protein jhhlp_000371 [Lomentospora prolificans]
MPHLATTHPPELIEVVNGLSLSSSTANGAHTLPNGRSDLTSGQGGEDPINVIIPIGGIGSRFSKQGYRYPKPLINIVGRPMLLWLIDSLVFKARDTLWLAVNEDIDDEFRIGQLVAKSFTNLDFRLIRLRHQTKGASETLYIVTQSMPASHLSRKTVSLDCDTIYWADILQDIRDMPRGHGGCFYFMDHGDKPIFSYIKTEFRHGLERIADIQEKKAITRKANTGAYVFPSAAELRVWAAHNLDLKRDDGFELGEYYTSQVIALMIQRNVPFLGIPVKNADFSCVGTPEQLEDLLRLLKTNPSSLPMKLKKRRFCFDLDFTLVGAPAVPGDYSTCPPIEKNIRLVQQLYDAGHYIIIQTARRMRTHNGNLGAILAEVGPVTFAQLAKYKIPFHDIHFGKPYADVYVDDLAVNANLDTMREIGWLLDDPDPSTQHGQPTCSPSHVNKSSMIAARDFNTIQIIGDKVIKSSKSANILGELYFYSHMPPTISHLFPAVYDVDLTSETRTYSITMENRRGLTFSHLLVGRSITKGRLLSFLRALRTIHTASTTNETTLSVPTNLAERFEAHSLSEVGHQVNIYANYGSKLRSRYSQFKDRYDALGPLASSIFNRLNEFLDTYEAEKKGAHAQVIHGDPVFSNAILSKDERLVSFIDVRCQLGNTVTPEGDIHYDLAKVLQSLCGYDHVMFMSTNNYDLTYALDGPNPLLDDADTALLEELQEHFFAFVEGTYAERIHRKTLFRITASLFFSLIPLHRPELGPVFLHLCKETLEKASGISQAPANLATSLSRSSSSGSKSDSPEAPAKEGMNGKLSG